MYNDTQTWALRAGQESSRLLCIFTLDRLKAVMFHKRSNYWEELDGRRRGEIMTLTDTPIRPERKGGRRGETMLTDEKKKKKRNQGLERTPWLGASEKRFRKFG